MKPWQIWIVSPLVCFIILVLIKWIPAIIQSDNVEFKMSAAAVLCLIVLIPQLIINAVILIPAMIKKRIS